MGGRVGEEDTVEGRGDTPTTVAVRYLTGSVYRNPEEILKIAFLTKISTEYQRPEWSHQMQIAQWGLTISMKSAHLLTKMIGLQLKFKESIPEDHKRGKCYQRLAVCCVNREQNSPSLTAQ